MDTSSWKWFRYNEIFNIKKGKRLTKENMTDGNIRYIGAIDSNNGLSALIGNDSQLHSANTISVSYNGSIGYAFYQEKEFWATDDVNVLYPKFQLNRYLALYLCSLIEKEQYRFCYGRKWDLEMMNKSLIKLPVTPSGEPDWQYMEDFIKDRIVPQLPKKAQKVWIKKYDISPMKQDKNSLHIENWKSFVLKDIFTISRGKTLTADDKEYYVGNIPCVNGTSTDNGVLCYLNEGIEEKGFKKQPVPSLSLCRVGSSGLTFVQNKPYYIADNAFCLQLKTQQNLYAYLFISTLLDKECIKYCYGRTISSEKYMQTRIKLPVTPSGEPDWKFMEDYIKSLPYSKNIEPSKPNEIVDELMEVKKRVIEMQNQLAAQQQAQINNYGTLNIYEK